MPRIIQNRSANMLLKLTRGAVSEITKRVDDIQSCGCFIPLTVKSSGSFSFQSSCHYVGRALLPVVPVRRAGVPVLLILQVAL